LSLWSLRHLGPPLHRHDRPRKFGHCITDEEQRHARAFGASGECTTSRNVKLNHVGRRETSEPAYRWGALLLVRTGGVLYHGG